MKSTKPKSTPINPDKYAASGTEDAEQIALFMWAALNVNTWPELKYMFAIPNGMYTPNKRVAGRMRAMGMKRGVSDILLPVKRGEWSGLFLELKKRKTETAKGVVQPEQKEFGEFVVSQGFGFIVCYGFEQARDTILEYLSYIPIPKIRKMTDEDLKEFKTGEW